MIKIDKGFSIPPPNTGPRSPFADVYDAARQMNVGDSISLSEAGVPASKFGSVHRAIWIAAKQAGRKIASRKIKSDMRIWRVK